MNIIGKWKLKSIYAPTDEGLKLYTAEDIPEEFAYMFEENKDMLLEFSEDGTLNTVVKAEGDYLEMAKAEGVEIRDDGYIVAFSTRWEEHDGKYRYDSGFEGEILDEDVDPFVDIDVTDDGCIIYNCGMCIYERV